MNRLLVVVLAAFDAAIAAVVGLAAALAPLTLLWVFGFGGGADWGLLWPAAARVWQFGMLVPVEVALPDAYLVAAGIPVEGADFVLSLAPLAFAAFTALFAARSGARAAHSGAGLLGVASGTLVFTVLTALIALTTFAPIASVAVWQAILLPSAVYLVPAALGAFVTAWREGDDGVVDAMHDAVDDAEPWRGVVPAAARGLAAVVVGALGVGAAVLAVALAVGAAAVVALFESAHVDLVGAVAIGLAQLAYLPTLVVWGLSFAAGPGFRLGEGGTVSAAGTDLGVLPAIPVLGVVPEAPSQWLLLLAVAIVAVGAFAGWIARRRLIDEGTDAASSRLVILAALTVGSAAAAALLAVLASGAIGPGRLAVTGPPAGALALAIGVEVAIGAAIMLFGPRADVRRDEHVDWYDPMPSSDGGATARDGAGSAPSVAAPPAPRAIDIDMQPTEEIAPVAFLVDEGDTTPLDGLDPLGPSEPGEPRDDR